MTLFKALGPDGVHEGSYQHMWEIVGDTIYCFAVDFFDTGILLEGLIVPPLSNQSLQHDIQNHYEDHGQHDERRGQIIDDVIIYRMYYTL